MTDSVDEGGLRGLPLSDGRASGQATGIEIWHQIKVIVFYEKGHSSGLFHHPVHTTFGAYYIIDKYEVERTTYVSPNT